jgi:hypothetical protein
MREKANPDDRRQMADDGKQQKQELHHSIIPAFILLSPVFCILSSSFPLLHHFNTPVLHSFLFRAFVVPILVF